MWECEQILLYLTIPLVCDASISGRTTRKTTPQNSVVVKKQKCDITTLLTATIHFDGGSRGNGKFLNLVAGSGAFLKLKTEKNPSGDTLNNVVRI